ncbi:hypothetical protein NBO_10g0034 [Nosema bombycis CQ1]|uniref:Uncharacterized protein n=1 Tax=Nosema bombycis (strain CQ1 / CVCC 102059) TaxID=578461 RepID=R0MAQ0_NOSB1|nr:hypothetical protein NBO_10g0034 [Nosema bombycis CQ1]|eukprot:EOB15044.1 hypothetical protein NBO_10g0034 [Nosema bombycis CQ1]
MLNRILEIVAKEDTFSLFSHGATPSVYDLQRYNLKTTSSIKVALEMFFRNIIEKSVQDSLYWSEANRMLRFISRLFHEINEISKEGTTNDDVTDCYIESILDYTEDINVNIIKEHVRFIMK